MRLVVRRLAVSRGEAPLVEWLARCGKRILVEQLRVELARLRDVLKGLSRVQWARFVGVALLRWAAPKKHGLPAAEVVGLAVGTVRNTVDAALGDIWKRLLTGSPLQVAERVTILWHLFEPTLAELDAALRFHQLCAADHESAASVKAHRQAHDRHQAIAREEWRSFCLALEAWVSGQHEMERRLLGWADVHLVADHGSPPIAERTLLERLCLCANRPEASGRAALRVVLALLAPHLVAPFDVMDSEARAADTVRGAWHSALTEQQSTLRASAADFDLVQQAFIRNLTAAHGRLVKG